MRKLSLSGGGGFLLQLSSQAEEAINKCKWTDGTRGWQKADCIKWNAKVSLVICCEHGEGTQGSGSKSKVSALSTIAARLLPQLHPVFEH